MQNLSLSIIDSDSQARKELAGIIGSFGSGVDILSASADFEEGMRRIQESRPEIVILDVREVTQGARETSAILSRSPQTTVFVTCDEKNPDWILKLIRAGAGEYLTKPVNADELVDAVKKVTRLRAPEGKPRGRAIALYNPSGGMGTTTTAVNLAATLAAKGEKVALVDLNLLTSDIATFLDLTPRYTMGDVMGRTGHLDASFMQSVMTRHASGVDVLTGPTKLADAERLQPGQVHELLTVLKSIYAHTIIDMGGALTRCNLAAFHECDHILYLSVINLPGLKNARRYMTALSEQGFGAQRVKFVANRYQAKDDINLAAAEKVLNAKIFATLPNTYLEAKESVNRGEPQIRFAGRSQMAKAMDEMAGRLIQENSAAKMIQSRGV